MINAKTAMPRRAVETWFGPAQDEVLGSLRHQMVRVVLLDGKSISGELISADKYCLGLDVPGTGSVLVWKSALKYLALAPARLATGAKHERNGFRDRFGLPRRRSALAQSRATRGRLHLVSFHALKTFELEIIRLAFSVLLEVRRILCRPGLGREPTDACTGER